jgi:hypothetical protein
MAAAHVSKEFPRAILKVAGEGPLRAELQEWIAVNASGVVSLLGLLPWAEVLEL